MVNMLVAAAVAAATQAAAPAAPPATTAVQIEPAMFVIRDADTTVYIFGTFHALDGQGNWFSDRVRNAFEQSDELVLETLVPERPGQIALPMPGFKPPSVTPSASFLATTRMAINAGKSQGMQVGNGADMVLRHVAESEGKPVEGLETLESQLAMFNRLPPAPTAPAPRPGQPVANGSMEKLSKAMAAMQSAWKRGDQSVFVDLLSQLRTGSPDTYRMMFTERNTRWADWIRARMQTPGTVFVAVGAGHLAGPDSVLVRLAERGLPSQRVY
nr:TraB/GumN family protein [Sphingomonas sp.]